MGLITVGFVVGRQTYFFLRLLKALFLICHLEFAIALLQFAQHAYLPLQNRVSFLKTNVFLH
jgi:hypothetical protein